MANKENKKYYWLRLKEDFFSDDTIRYIEEQENGVYYSNFYLKLCLKSLKTEGRLMRLIGSNLMPYDIKSLANLTGVDIDTVAVAMNLFEKIGLIEIMETGEIYLAQIEELIGGETEKAALMRRKRAEDKLKSNKVTAISNNVTKVLPERYPEIEIEKEIDIELEKEKRVKEKKTTFSPTTYIQEQSLSPSLEEKVLEWFGYKKERRESYKETGLKSLCTQIKNKANEYGEQVVIDLITECMANGWKGIIWDKLKSQPAQKNNSTNGNVFLDIAVEGNDVF